MKHFYLKCLFFGIFSLIGVNTFAYDCQVDGIFYNLDTTAKTASVTYRYSTYSSYSGAVTIPSTITYSGTTYSVTSIGFRAFYGCNDLTSVVISSSVTSIGQSAFLGCSGLTSVVIPSSVTSIGAEAFRGCSGLTSIVVESGNSVYDSRNNCNAIIHTTTNTLIAGCNNTMIPSSVTRIENYAFSGCNGLTSIEIPSGVTSIGVSAFSGCSGLTSIEIPSGVTSIGVSTFSGCSGLTSIVIPSGVTSIGNEAFRGCSGLISIAIPSSVTSIGDDAFSGTAWYNNQPDGVVYAGKIAYVYKGTMPANTSVTIKEGTLIIRNGIFSNCSSLNSVVVPSSVTSIEEAAFFGCSSLTSVIIGNSVTSIGFSAFYNCPRLTTIYSLNPIPPYCSGISTFSCESGVRDKYDIYTYATLHVPMGSEELYSSAYEWRYFNKIKEDMESNGNVYYANLTVKQGAIGYTRQAVKADTRHTIYIGSLGENKVNTVTFNGVDVTDEVVNGYYTTPEIKGESVLSISFETNASVKSMSLNELKVMGYNGEIQIKNIDEPSDVFVYSVDGKLVGNVPSAYGSASIQVASEELYVVKVSSRVFKVAL